MIDCILLAAGNAVRFGENKLMYRIDGVPMGMRAISLHAALPYRRRVLVTQTGYEAIAHFAEQNGFAVVYNEAPERGLGSSIRTAIAALSRFDGKAAGVLFGVCDQPYLKKETVQALCEKFAGAPDQIAVLACGTRRGNPVIFPQAFLPELASLDDRLGGVAVMKAHPERVLCCPIAAEKELCDIDTKQEAIP